MKRKRSGMAVVSGLVVVCFALLLGLLLQGSLGNAQTDQQRLWAIASQLHAPGDTTTQTVATSTVPSAWKMRAQIQQLLLAGNSNQAVLRTIEQEYGPASYADPASSGFGLWVWLLPVVVLAIGALAFAVGYLKIKHRTTETALEMLAHTAIDVDVNLDDAGSAVAKKGIATVTEDWRKYI